MPRLSSPDFLGVLLAQVRSIVADPVKAKLNARDWRGLPFFTGGGRSAISPRAVVPLVGGSRQVCRRGAAGALNIPETVEALVSSRILETCLHESSALSCQRLPLSGRTGPSP